MKLKAMIGAACVAATAMALAAPASAEGHLRGGMTSVKNVAGTLAGNTQYTKFKWVDGRGESFEAAEAPKGDNFKWANRPADNGMRTAKVDADASEARHKWKVKADADQARHKWKVKADADQARHKWKVKADADQARHKWKVK